jgi:hypothetical protein
MQTGREPTHEPATEMTKVAVLFDEISIYVGCWEVRRSPG